MGVAENRGSYTVRGGGVGSLHLLLNFAAKLCQKERQFVKM